MRKLKFGLILCLIAVAGFVLGADREQMSITELTTVTVKGVDGNTAITVGDSGAVTLAGAQVQSGIVTQSGLKVKTPTALSVTNGAVITITAEVMVLTGIGGANDTTNAVTVANAGAIGTEVIFVIDSASSNLVSFADGGNLSLSGATVLDNNDTLSLYFVAVGNGVETGQTDN